MERTQTDRRPQKPSDRLGDVTHNNQNFREVSNHVSHVIKVILKYLPIYLFWVYLSLMKR